MNTSTIEAKSIFFDSPTTTLSIDSTSNITTNGRSANSRGYYENQGAAYVGQGGYCPQDGKQHFDKHYGEFDMMPNFNNIYDMKQSLLVGSIGEYNPLDVRTAGGGHMHFNLDALRLTGRNYHIQSNGLPRWDQKEKDLNVDLNGGSGGYIYINTKEKYGENRADWSSKISVIGGYGKNKGVGGAGGVIVFGHDVTDHFASINTRTMGGRGGSARRPYNSTACGSAAAGTVYWASTDVLIVSNNFRWTNKHTFLTAKRRSPDKFPGKYLAADNMIISGAAHVNIICNAINRLVFDKFHMWPWSTEMVIDARGVSDLILNYNEQFTMYSWGTYLDLTNVTGTVFLQNLNNKHDRRELVVLNNVQYSRGIHIDVTTLVLNGKIYDPLESKSRQTVINLFANHLSLNKSAEMQADNMFLYANETLKLHGRSKLTSTV